MRIYLIKIQKNKTPINFSESTSSFSRLTLASCYIQNRCCSPFIQNPLYFRIASLYYSFACLLMSLKSNITGRSSALSSLSKEGKNICGEVSGQLWLKYLKHTTCKNTTREAMMQVIPLKNADTTRSQSNISAFLLVFVNQFYIHYFYPC